MGLSPVPPASPLSLVLAPPDGAIDMLAAVTELF